MSNSATPDLEAVVRAVLAAVSPGPLVATALSRVVRPGPCRLLAVGKAAHAMAAAAIERFGEDLRAGVLIAPPLAEDVRAGTGACDDRVKVFEADHPLPTGRNVAAAEAAAELVRGIEPGESLLVLLSGGASALLTLPAEGVSLDDLRALTSALLRAGATIDELNCVRKHCEQLKGGGLAKLAAEAGCLRVVALILSDVVGDRLEVIGSGPTAPDPTSYSDAVGVLAKYELQETAQTIVRRLHAGAAGKVPETLKPGDAGLARVENCIIGSNSIAVRAAAAELRQQGIEIIEERTGVTGEAPVIGERLAGRLRSVAKERGPHRAIVWGGETTVTVRGTGAGGRNQELALAAAIALDGERGCGVMSLATDGVDGNSPAAGAMVNGETLALARAAGLHAAAALAENDSFTFFARLNAAIKEKSRRILIQTGPTGTNVNDVVIGYAAASSPGSGLNRAGL